MAKLNTNNNSNTAFSSNSDAEQQSSQTSNISSYNHEKALDFLTKTAEALKKQDSSSVENVYNKVDNLMNMLCESPNFKAGFDKAINLYKSEIQDNNKDFVLIQFLEDFWERFIPDDCYTEDMRNSDFNYALSLSAEVNAELIGDLCQI